MEKLPGHLKNLLDWLSRPVKPMDYATPTCINGKRVAVPGEAWGTDVLVLTDEQKAQLKAQAEKLV